MDYQLNTSIRSLINPEYLLNTAKLKYDLGNISNCKVIKFGGSNDIFLITRSSDKLILKIFFKRQCWEYCKNHFLFELELQSFLSKKGISSSKPIANKLGELIETITLPEGNRFFAIYEYEHGEKWEHSSKNDKRFYKLGKTLNILHSLSEEFQKTNSYTRKLDMDKMLHKSWKDIDLLIKLPTKKIKAQLFAIYEDLAIEANKLVSQQTIKLIHGDAHCGNHLHDTAKDLTTLIDFELSGYGYVNYELSVLKYDLIKNNHNKKFINAVMEEFISGYQSTKKQLIDIASINFFVKLRYFFMLGSSFLFYPDKAEFNNEFILGNYIKAIRTCDKFS